MAFFDTFDRTGRAEFNFPKSVVFRALCDGVSSLKGMSIESKDPAASVLHVKTGMSAFSWGERISVSVVSTGENAAALSVSSGAKTIFGSATTHGKNNQNVRQIIEATSRVLQRSGAAWVHEIVPKNTTPAATEAGSRSFADEIEKLATLRDRGLLTQEEFDAQKRKLLQQ